MTQSTSQHASLVALITIQDFEKPLVSASVQHNKSKIKQKREIESKAKVKSCIRNYPAPVKTDGICPYIRMVLHIGDSIITG